MSLVELGYDRPGGFHGEFMGSKDDILNAEIQDGANVSFENYENV